MPASLSRIYRFFREVARGFSADGCLNMAAATAFYAILSTLPLLFVLVSGAAFFFEGAEEVMKTLFHAVDTVVPSLGEGLKREILAVVKRRGLIGGMGLIIMLWSSTLVFSSLEFAFNRIFRIEERRSFLRSKLVNMALVVLGVVALSASVLLTTAAELFQSGYGARLSLQASRFFSSSIFIRYLLPLLILTLLFTVLFTILTRRQVTLKEGIAGGGLCALLFEGAKYLFTGYIAGLGRHSLIYGSLWALVAVILWFFYAAAIILFTGELIAVWKRRKEIN